jgi:quercetin dioxygenase-like cupin family protein
MRSGRVDAFVSIALLFFGGCATTTTTTKPEGPATMPATPPRSVVTTLLTETLPEGIGREVRMLQVVYPPGASTPAHHHPGAVFVYVAEGAVQCALDDGPVVRYEKGQSWWERPGQVHRVARNASDVEAARLIVFFVTTPGSPVLEMQK